MRHPLDNFIAGWLDENCDAFVDCYVSDPDDNDSDGMVEINGEINVSALVRAINEKFAVIELPEPDDPALSHNGVGWKVPAPHHSVYDGFFQIEDSATEYGQADRAEAVGVALIACARYRRAREAAGLPAGTAGRDDAVQS